jgi:predicted permease
VAVFQFADPMIRRPLAVPDGDRVVRIVAAADRDERFSHATFQDLRTRTRAFADIAAHQYTTVSLGTGEQARALGGEVVSGNYFAILGIQPALGRLLQPADDDEVGAHPLVVISHGLWRDHFALAPDVVGRTIRLNGYPLEVIGVAPAGFAGSYSAFATRFWAPITMYRQVRPQNNDLHRRGWSWLSLTARLAHGVDLPAADADLARVAADLDRESPQDGEKRRFMVLAASGLPERMRRSAGPVLSFAALTAALVLLVTCANIAGVMQSRVAARVRETSIRFALGASRFRVLRQAMTESLCLALIGGGAGLVAARWLVDGLAGLLRPAVPLELSSSPVVDSRTLVFTTIIALLAGLLFGLMPAWRFAARGESALRETSTTLAGNRRGARSIRGLVAVQVAACVCLLITAGLLTRSLRNVRTFDPGFQSAGVVVSRLDFRRHGYDRARAGQFVEALLRTLRARPDVSAASFAAVVPLGGDQERLGFRIPGHTTPAGRTIVPIDMNAVGSDYFQTMGIGVIRGRGIAEGDDEQSRPVAVVNETMARRYWPDGNAVGGTIFLAGTPELSLTIVGVTRDIKYYSLDETPRPYVYVSAMQQGLSAPVVLVRVNGTASGFVAPLKREIAGADPNVVAEQTMTFDELRQQPLVLRRAMAALANVFGALALLLAIVGIYGTMSNAVGQRTREIGVRLAFGARTNDVYRLILRDGLMPVAAGIVLGLAAASMVTRLITTELFGVTAADPLTHLVAIAGVVLASTAALSVPARRATRVDPVAILREQ